jgi:hypothetical protein
MKPTQIIPAEAVSVNGNRTFDHAIFVMCLLLTLTFALTRFRKESAVQRRVIPALNL